MRRKPENCSRCGKSITKDNPSYSGGGAMDNAGNWTEYAYGACCNPPLKAQAIQDIMAKVFKDPMLSK